MATPHITYSRLHDSSQPAWPRWPLIVLLSVLFLGPIIAPLFQATQLWLVADSGALARDLLATYICPTPAKSYHLLGYPMAVCARCWGATIGLWLAWFGFAAAESGADAGVRLPVPGGSVARALLASSVRIPLDWYCARPWFVRLALAVPPFLLWVAEIRWWSAAPLWVLLLNGACAGFAAGLSICSLWPGLATQARSRITGI